MRSLIVYIKTDRTFKPATLKNVKYQASSNSIIKYKARFIFNFRGSGSKYQTRM